MKSAVLGSILILLAACAASPAPAQAPQADGRAALDYLRELEGQWVVQGGNEGPFGWEFDVTSRGGVVVERLKVGTSTEMTTIYHLDDGTLIGTHYCQLGNQPRLTAVNAEAEEDLHFVCDGAVGSAESHAELHMHGVHFQAKGDSLLVWMDMFENGEVAFQTSYELVRAHPASTPAGSR
jgi:hypothetical protein